jgi:UrcA family protein
LKRAQDLCEIQAKSSPARLHSSHRRQFRQPDADRRSDMTHSALKFGFPLALALAVASAAAIAQEKEQTPEVKIQAGQVQKTTVGNSYTGIPIERLQVELPVSYANLNLATSSGAAELEKRVSETAKEACARLDAADPLDMSDSDNISCVRETTAGAMKQARAAIAAAANGSASRSPQMSAK